VANWSRNRNGSIDGGREYQGVRGGALTSINVSLSAIPSLLGQDLLELASDQSGGDGLCRLLSPNATPE
jgi:hypothetical protein